MQVDNHVITILYHLHQCRPCNITRYFIPKLARVMYHLNATYHLKHADMMHAVFLFIAIPRVPSTLNHASFSFMYEKLMKVTDCNMPVAGSCFVRDCLFKLIFS